MGPWYGEERKPRKRHAARGTRRALVSLLDAHRHGVQALRESSGRLLGVRADFDRLSQRRWRQLTVAIGKVELPRPQRAADYWERAAHGRHPAVRSGSGLDSFIWLLADSGILRPRPHPG